jgi:hypothetical protein
MAISYTILAEGVGTYRVRVKEFGIIPGEYFGPFTSEAEAKRFIAGEQERLPLPVAAIRNNS